MADEPELGKRRRTATTVRDEDYAFEDDEDYTEATKKPRPPPKPKPKPAVAPPVKITITQALTVQHTPEEQRLLDVYAKLRTAHAERRTGTADSGPTEKEKTKAAEDATKAALAVLAAQREEQEGRDTSKIKTTKPRVGPPGRPAGGASSKAPVKKGDDELN